MLEKINEFKDYIIIGGMIIGVVGILDFLPTSIEAFNIGDKVVYGYVFIICLGIFLYHKNHWSGKSASFDRTTTSRNLSNPKYLSEIQRQRGTKFSQSPPKVEQAQQQVRINPGSQVWDTFKKD